MDDQSELISSKQMRAAYLKLTVFYLAFAIVTVFVAGTANLPYFWAIILLQSLVSLICKLILDPRLLAERLKPQGKDLDRASIIFLMISYPLQFVLAVLDTQRFHLTDSVPMFMRIAGLGVAAFGWFLFVWSMKTNFYFSSAIRLQSDRGQHVVDKGPYAWVRHPGYAGFILVFLAEPTAMGSWLAVLIGVCMVIGFVRRTLIEEKMLFSGLPGYAEYASRVRYRWFPLIW